MRQTKLLNVKFNDISHTKMVAKTAWKSCRKSDTQSLNPCRAAIKNAGYQINENTAQGNIHQTSSAYTST
jgi:hypothetical protein